MRTQRIYYDDDDAKADGYGWNIVDDGGAVSVRVASAPAALAWCYGNDAPFYFDNDPIDVGVIHDGLGWRVDPTWKGEK